MKAALIVGVLVVAGCTAASPSPSARPSESSPPAATVSPLPTPTAAASSEPGGSARITPTPTAAGSVSGLAFERVASFEGTELYAATAFAGGFAIGGCRLGPGSDGSEYGACAEARLLVSSDGRTWSDVELGDEAGRQIIGLAETPLGILAFGLTFFEEPPAARTIWRSADGLTWERYSMPAPQPVVFSAAFVLDGRTVLIGSDTSYDLAVETEAWSTVDGRAWTSGSTPMTAKVAGDPGLVAFGEACVDICPEDPTISVERSVDGLRWTRDAADPSLAGGAFHALGSWAGHAVAGGVRGDGEAQTATVWIDMPGGWRRSLLPDGQGYQVQSLVVVDGRLVAVARSADDTTGRAWSSVDGQTWERVALGGLEDDFVVAWAGRGPVVAIGGWRTIWRLGG